MTIALGIIATDGIVVAADRQVTIPGWSKQQQGKIWLADHADAAGHHGACLVSGATNRWGYLESLAQQVTRVFLARQDAMTNEDVGNVFGEAVRDFHQLHVVPYQDYPEVELVLGYQRNGTQGLWLSERGALVQRYDHASVGIGASVAAPLLDRLWCWNQYDMAEAVALAVYVIGRVKESVDGCGARTDAVCLSRDRYRRVKTTTVDILDRLFSEHVDEHEAAAFAGLIGVELAEEYRPTRSERVLRSRIRGQINRIRGSVAPPRPDEPADGATRANR